MTTRNRATAVALMGTLLASLILTVGVPTVAAAAFSNGSFETGPGIPPPGGNSPLIAGDTTSMPPWTVSAGSIDWIDNGYWQAKAGLRSLDLSGTAAGGISQTFDTTPGATYSVTFWMSGNPLGGPAVKTMTVGAVGSPAATFTYNTSTAGNTLADMRYAAKAYSFTAACDSRTSTVTFTSAVAGNYGPVLDDVKIALATTQPVSPCKVPAPLCVVKFNDVDRNGTQGSGEPALTGWVFTVRDASNMIVATIGSAPGLSRCVDLPPGVYTVTETPQSGWTPTTAGGLTQTVTVVAGQTTTVTFGNHEQQMGRLCVLKFNDVDADGKQGGSEPLLSGWVITIRNSLGTVVNSITTGVGEPTCVELPIGTYSVTEALQSGWSPTTPGGLTQTATVTTGQTTTVTFGNRQVERICVIKFNDVNGNGKRDTGEALLSGWAFTVTDVASSAVVGTLASGTRPSCIDVKPGTYVVTETLQAGWTPTTSGGVSQTVTVAAGQTINLTFGNKRCCLTFTFLAGKIDNFSVADGATAEPVTPVVITAAPAYFDATKSNLAFAHRFNLGSGNCIESARLTMKIRTLAADAGSANDTMSVKVPGSTGSWARPVSTVAPAGPWTPTKTKTVTFNLGAMPSGGGSTTLIAALNTRRMLDINIQDDTKVDYIRLVVVFCECAGNPPH